MAAELFERLYLCGATKINFTCTGEEAEEIYEAVRIYRSRAYVALEMAAAHEAASGSPRLRVTEATLKNLDDNTGFKNDWRKPHGT